MVERVCPSCQNANSLADRYCGKCGTALERHVLARRGEHGLTIAGRSFPVSWQQVGKTAALGAAAIVAEVGLVWLRRRLEQGPTNVETALTRSHMPPVKHGASRDEGSVVTIISQRVIEIFQQSDGSVQIKDRHVWQRRDE